MKSSVTLEQKAYMSLFRNFPCKAFCAELTVPKITTYLITRIIVTKGIVLFGVTKWRKTIVLVLSLLISRKKVY